MTQYVYYRALEKHRQRDEAAQLRRQQRHLHYHGLPQQETRIRPPELLDAAVRCQPNAILSSDVCMVESVAGIATHLIWAMP